MTASPGKLQEICSNLRTRNGRDLLTALTACGAALGFPLMFLVVLLLGSVSTARAATVSCVADYGGVIDGNNFTAATLPSSIQIDGDCTFQNFPQSAKFPDGLTSTINFYFDGYLAIFDNVYYTGNMACANTTDRIWFANSSFYGSNNTCQDLFIPVESIDKRNPAGQTTAAIGVPFTYSLTLPSMQITGDPSANDLHTVTLWDNLAATGADLTYVSLNAYYKGSGTPVTLVPETDPSAPGGVWTPKNLSYEPIPLIYAGDQIVVEITVVLDNTPANTPGTPFINTAQWSFGRLIDGVYYQPLPGESGVTQPMTIAGPNLVVTKTGSETALNLGVPATFTIDVQNTGGSGAWNTTILDDLPPFSGGAGMCDYDPRTALSARIVEANGTTLVRNLTAGTDYTLNYTGAPTCQLSLTMTQAGGTIGSGQHLIITYQSQLDSATTANNVALTNVAGATQWFSSDGTYTPHVFNNTLTNGTPGILDFQDNYTLYTALAGYYFQKTVENLTSRENPATTAAPSDRLRYRLRLFNVDQTIDGITITDLLDPNSFDLTTFAMVTPPPAGATYSFNSTSGLLTITGNPPPLNVAVGGELVIEFDITLKSSLTNGAIVANQATLTATGITAQSDDPYVNGVAPPGEPADPTRVVIQAPGQLTKANTQASATIGEQFTYRITVPATPVDVPLYDVRILDDLSLSNANLQFVSATVVSGGTWTLSNTGSATNLVLEDSATGIDIPANGQAVIEITVELQNTLTNQSGVSFTNSASYTYNRMNGNNATQTVGGGSSTLNMVVVEPNLTATKAVTFVTPAGKLPTDPATVGDVLQYTVTIPNNGGSTAFDTNVVDTLPANLSLVPGSATAEINGVPVAGFVVTPTTLPGSALAWGSRNGDGTLDIPVGQSLVLTYRVTVMAVTGTNITNSVFVDWTSLDGGSTAERTGAGCPTTDTLNDYCYGPATVSVTTLDNTSITKSVVGDSYAETPPSTTDPIVRVGDTVTYDLTLHLQEYTTSNVVVEDDLPVGMALESFTIVAGANFTFTLAAQPAAGNTGTLRWEFGDITNQPSNDGTPVDTLVIQYVARVVTDAPPVGVGYNTSILLNNLARLSYTGGDPAAYPNRLTATERIDVRQPQMRAISKIDLGTGRVGTGTVADPYQVNISTDVMKFHLSSCNDGLAPAYGVIITDQLAPELDESTLSANPPVVKIGTTTLTAGTDYTFTAPARGGQLKIALLDSAPINPGECVTVDYNIGFHTDLTTSSTWSNQAQLPEYRSLPLSEPGRLYTSASLAEVWMTNLVNNEQLLKTLVSPAEATIGDDVVYRIKVPAVPMNTALDNVVVTDTLHGALEYVSASAVDGGGAPVSLADNSVAPVNISLGIATIPAGGQVIITLTTRVANNAQANAGVTFTNTASYTYTNIPAGLDTSSTSGPLKIIEPLLTIAKTVTNVSNPGAAPNVGDILRYTVRFTASGGAVGDNFSDAFDLLIDDGMSLGLAYKNGTASVNGAGNTITDPTVTGDGVTIAQTLTWSQADGTADIDVVEGTQVTLTYDAVVLNGVVAGQVLTNNATVQWTGQNGNNVFERNGTDGIGGINDYVATTAAPPLTVPFPTLTLQKTVDKPVANPGDRLHYTLVIINPTDIGINNFTLVDEIDRLNAMPMFQPGSIGNVSVPAGASYTINNGTLSVTGLTIGPNGSPSGTLTIEFDAVLKTDLKSGTVVLNQGELQGGWPTPIMSDDPTVSGNENPTQTVIPADGVVYASSTRQPLGGVTLTMRLVSTGADLPTSCFIDPSQQHQVTPASGEYKFDLKFDPVNCPEGADYLIIVTAVPTGYVVGPSLVIVPTTSDQTSPYSVPVCPADAIPSTPQCEAQVSSTAPTGAITTYYLHLTFDSTANQIFNNHIPVDPYVNETISITKSTPLVNVTRGQLVPYTITFKNTRRDPLPPLGIIDTLPPGFKYVNGSGRFDDQSVSPNSTGQQLQWNIPVIGYDVPHTIKLILVVGSGVSEGKYVNRAQVINTDTGEPMSEVATATVRVTPDPTFDCTDVIGKVFDDRNLNGFQDPGEKGLFGVRVVTARGLIASTDEYGRFHITCAVVPEEDQGSNFILKLDERSLPSGYRMTTENPRVERATLGKMIRFNFGATIQRVVRIDIADGAFEPNTSEIRIQWKPKIAQLMDELKKGPAVLRLSYLGDAEPKSLVQERLEALKKIITEQWNESESGYRLTIEIEIFWRRGASASASVESWFSGAETPSDATEMNLPMDQTLKNWVRDPAVYEKDEGDRTEMREGVGQHFETVKLENLVPPIHFGEGEAEIPDHYLKLLRDVLDRMRDRANVRLHFVGHTDSLPLRGELIRIYGDNEGLSRERAGTVAEYFQRALNLPPEAISYEGLGDSQPVATNTTEEGRQLNRRVEVQVWYDKISEKKTVKEVIVPNVVNRIKVCRSENVCKLRYKEGQSHRARIRNMISPLQYDKGMLSVPEKFLQQIRQTVTQLNGKQNLVVKFIGYTDNIPLEGRDKRIYGDSIGLSKAVARRVSLAVQEDLSLPNAAIEIDGKGMSQPVTSNDTEQGRALNRRVEVEFWYDDPLQDLPEDPQPCPGAPGAETVTRIYNSPSGPIVPILFENGKPVIPEGYAELLRRIMSEISDKPHVRLQFVGYTGDQRLDRRTAEVYGDDIGLSMARARRAMEAVSQMMGLAEGQAEYDGRGYVQSDDVINAGFVESDTSRVEVNVVYDDQIVRDDYEGVEVTPLTREVHPTNPFALMPLRITVDGMPIDDPNKSGPDLQRCIDVALDNASIEFKYDSLKLEPRLNVTAWPDPIQYRDLPETEFVENLVNFRLYTNYRSFITRAEVRIFDEKQSVRDKPIAVVPMDADGMAQWQPDFESFSAPLQKLKYLVRVYDKHGDFDETSPQPLWVVNHIDPSVAKANLGEKLLAGYGESRIAVHNIPLTGGTVQAYGTAIPKGDGVWMAGYKVPVDHTDSFVAEEILPEGLHTVEVGVLDPSGNGKLYLRDLALKKSDWFTVGIADLTLSGTRTSGPAEQLAKNNPLYSHDLTLQGHLAFFTKGKFDNGWSLMASADTGEGTFDEIFSNFLDKSPEALFRRIDPNYHYPSFGDDSTVEQEAPTDGKFYLKLSKDKTYGLWGNFRIDYTDNYLVRMTRGLYGANLHFQPLETTRFGEERLKVEGFAADPGTVADRDEFLGTGGSLYFLHRQDILEGSERVRIEVRDKDSGTVIGVKNLTPVLDYEVDYLQGRIVLLQPLPSIADDGLLVSTTPISGNPVYLVVHYEFTPGFENPNMLDFGGRIQYWINDYVKVGVTASQDRVEGVNDNIGGADVTLRLSQESWLKIEGGHTNGPGSITTTSDNGGYNFQVSDNENQSRASSYRIDSSLDFKDLFEHGRGKVTFYMQDLQAGYSAPGLTTAKGLTQYGGTAELPVTDFLNVHLKVDKLTQVEGLDTEAGELDLAYKISKHWTLSSGVRRDSREDNSVVVPATQEEGDLTTAVARLQYDSQGRWSTYGFAQQTVQKSGNREDNDRIGVGGSFRFTDKFNVTGEVSGGNMGPGVQLSSEYLYTDRTTLYSKYTYQDDRTDNGLRARKGMMTSGFRTRYSDSASVFFEEQYTHGDVPTGLMHSTGVDLAPIEHLNLGLNLQLGDLKDQQTGADLKRTSAGVSVGYGFDKLKISSALEYRLDDAEQTDKSTIRRTTWFLKNSLKYQLSPNWQIIGKFDYAVSSSPSGTNYDGEYTEAVLGYAYRPVHNDRLNALFKYTYFYNVPTSGQVTGISTPANYIQRSHILAMDVMYDLTTRWTVGGKFAYRYGQLAQDRDHPDYFTSRAILSVLRADWHFIFRWDALIEVRRLDLTDAKDSRNGVLVGIYRQLNNTFKVGAGYNFSDFSDDLTQLDYRNQGVFINLIGKM
jgi:uncharacterized repeat protein (TIGR01451 family)/fimbrial isopeptide formation D2 family protein